jgi:hypothetical protein
MLLTGAYLVVSMPRRRVRRWAATDADDAHASITSFLPELSKHALEVQSGKHGTWFSSEFDRASSAEDIVESFSAMTDDEQTNILQRMHQIRLTKQVLLPE